MRLASARIHVVRGSVRLTVVGLHRSSWLRPKTSKYEAAVAPTEVKILNARGTTSRGEIAYLLRLDSITTRNDAEAMRGATVLVRSEDRQPLDGDTEFYVQDLVGLRVTLLVSASASSCASESTRARACLCPPLTPPPPSPFPLPPPLFPSCWDPAGRG